MTTAVPLATFQKTAAGESSLRLFCIHPDIRLAVLLHHCSAAQQHSRLASGNPACKARSKSRVCRP